MENTNKWVAGNKEALVEHFRKHVNAKPEVEKLYSVKIAIQHYEGAIERGYKGYKNYLNKEEWLKDTNNIIAAYKIIYEEIKQSRRVKLQEKTK